MSDKISGKFHPIPSTIPNQRWISIHNIIIYLETKFRPNRRIFLFGGHFMPRLPWQQPPFYIFSNPKSCHILRWIFLQIFMKFDERNPQTIQIPSFVYMATVAKFVQSIPIFFFGLSHSTKVDVVPIKFHQFLFGK